MSMHTILDAQVPSLNEEFKLERFDNEILLYSVSDTTAVYLNETAFMVYAMCGSGQTVGEIISQLAEAYPDQKKNIREDVMVALSHLIDSGALLLND